MVPRHPQQFAGGAAVAIGDREEFLQCLRGGASMGLDLERKANAPSGGGEAETGAA